MYAWRHRRAFSWVAGRTFFTTVHAPFTYETEVTDDAITDVVSTTNPFRIILMSDSEHVPSVCESWFVRDV